MVDPSVRGTKGNVLTNGYVLVVDDDATLRSTVCTILGQAGYESEQAGTGEDALAMATGKRPSLVVLDVHLPGVSGYEVCHELKQRFGAMLPIIFISGDRVESYDRVAGLLIGADDYVCKPFAPDELVTRARGLIERSTAKVGSTLTTRELEVLRLLTAGMEARDIAEELSITQKTVAKHLEHVLTKLGVHTRAQAVALAYREGLL
jgi:DNA-binding response OmpR family regulator